MVRIHGKSVPVMCENHKSRPNLRTTISLGAKVVGLIQFTMEDVLFVQNAHAMTRLRVAVWSAHAQFAYILRTIFSLHRSDSNGTLSDKSLSN